MWFSQFAASALALASSAAAGTDTKYWQGNTDVKMLPLRTHSLAPPYLDSDMHSRWWDFGGDTVIRTDQYVRLTSERQSQQGWIFSRVPLTATNWEIEFEFKIHGSGHFHGDGFALWLTKQRATQGPVFGSVDRFEGLGIFFDTYKNNRPGTSFPYVMAMMGDGQTAYDQEHDGKANELAGCSARGLRDAAVPTKARLTYFQDRSLTLDLQYKSDGSWTECFSLTAPETNIAIPSVTYLGFSGETGEVTDKHDIISVTTHNLYDSSTSASRNRAGAPTARGRSAGRRKKAASSGGWMWFFFKIFLFVGLVAGVYVGYTIYRSSQRQSRF
ncbi:lectin family integral membrane protein, putative [Talaromyces stipitatus ATCC 10500]|uniref:Lectin family integral membrane protein, putative n=1 Tax=Talaromyces stipitatus (strain ATCC 10500 / CBS 375.48 / QM 6759 / NRRL 1006) TaxID=441959 RepID=B8MLH6_TALSN|nr:lectin family integral membrane protein, putative [Talaromyces stipitatus ATCC 10500]EED15509.1 lectin family integral membrane protein, putative [Talaromyces stipitatus ATCC 10500]